MGRARLAEAVGWRGLRQERPAQELDEVTRDGPAVEDPVPGRARVLGARADDVEPDPQHARREEVRAPLGPEKFGLYLG